MKFRLVEEIIVEDIQAVRRNYPKISDNDFMTLIALDPTYNANRDSVGKYGKWILNLFNKNAISLDDSENIKTLLKNFDGLRNDRTKKLSVNDIGQVKSLDQLQEVIDNVEEKELSNRQKQRETAKSVKDTDAQKDYIGTFGRFEVYSPSSWENSRKIAHGEVNDSSSDEFATWCTGSNSSSGYYDSYTRRGKLYILIDKNDHSNKYQAYVPHNTTQIAEFNDRTNHQVDREEFFSEYPEMIDAFCKILNIDLNTDENAIMLHNKKEQAKELKEIIDSFDDERTLDEYDMISAIDDARSRYETSVSGEDTIQLAKNPFEVRWGWWADYSFNDVGSSLYNNIKDKNILNVLKELGIETNNLKQWIEDNEDDDENSELVKDIKNAMTIAYNQASADGAAMEAEKDAIGFLEEDFKCVLHFGEELTATVSIVDEKNELKSMIDKIVVEKNDSSDEKDDKLTKFLSITGEEQDQSVAGMLEDMVVDKYDDDYIKSTAFSNNDNSKFLNSCIYQMIWYNANKEFWEPSYGWYGFDEKEFYNRLYEELLEIKQAQ